MTEAFVIGGAQRSGTTFLCHLFDRHPAIEMAQPLRPEPKLFLRPDVPTRHDYEGFFGRKPGACWRGEKSTSYMEHPEVLPRIEAVLPGCRYLFLLRDPVERAISNYWFTVANGAETLPIEEAFLREPERSDHYPRERFSVSPRAYLARGEYARLLAPFADTVPRERLAVGIFEHLIASPRELGRLLAFLGLPAADADGLLPGVRARNHAPRGSAVPPGVRERLRERFAEPNRELAARFDLDLTPWERAWQEPPPRLFFIVGRGRSGTTMLRQMLDANPTVFVPPEALFVVNLQRRYARGAWDDRRIRAFARDLWLEDRLRRWGFSASELEQRLLAVTPAQRGLGRLCLEVYVAGAAAGGKPRAVLVGDKNPHHALFAHQLARLFPEARFVHLVAITATTSPPTAPFPSTFRAHRRWLGGGYATTSPSSTSLSRIPNASTSCATKTSWRSLGGASRTCAPSSASLSTQRCSVRLRPRTARRRLPADSPRRCPRPRCRGTAGCAALSTPTRPASGEGPSRLRRCGRRTQYASHSERGSATRPPGRRR